MGTINHNAVIATTWDKEAYVRVSKWVGTLNNQLNALFVAKEDSLANQTLTIILCPDGSKEGWAHSYIGDKLRAEFIAELRKDDYEGGGSPWSWIEVGYGECGASIESTNCEDLVGIPEPGDTAMARVNRWKENNLTPVDAGKGEK